MVLNIDYQKTRSDYEKDIMDAIRLNPYAEQFLQNVSFKLIFQNCLIGLISTEDTELCRKNVFFSF